MDRFDFGGADFGVRAVFAATIQELARGLKAGDEIIVLEEGSQLEMLKFEVVEEANSGDVAAGKVRLVDDMTLRFPDDAAFANETGALIRVELSAGVR